MIRFAIWAAVSSKAQAEDDKVSIPDQIDTCRAAGLKRGWAETAVYAVLGESRTQWINLRDAEDAIVNPDGSHPLRDMLNDAQHGRFDVLVCYHYNRYRDLISPIEKTLQAYLVQMTSVSQWTDPQLPDSYEPLNDISRTIRRSARNASEDEIEEFRRRYQKYMPLRITRKGLPKGKAPHGYRKPPGHETDRKAIPVMDLLKIAVVVKIKDLFLNGRSLWQIADQLTAEHILTPGGKSKWTDVNVRIILKNRFYCGEVHFGKTRRVLDPRTGSVKIVDNPPSRMVTARGAHQPLWDMSTQGLIDDEFKKRGKKYTGIRTQRLSNLLYCGVCGARCWVDYPGGYADSRRRWFCSADRTHVVVKDTVLLPRFIEKLTADLGSFNQLSFPEPEDHTPLLTASLEELQTRRARILDAYESGALSLSDYSDRISSLDSQLNDLRTQLNKSQGFVQSRADRLKAIGGLRGILEQVPAYITTAPAQDVNAQLRSIIDKITITPTTVSITFI